MRSSNLLFSGVHLLVTLFVLTFGLILLIMPYAEGFRYGIAEFFMARPAMLFSLGLMVFGSGAFLMLGFFFMHRKRYFKLKMQCGKTEIEESIIKEYVREYWESLFPKKNYELEVVLGQSQKLEIVTKLPESLDDSSQLLERIKSELGVLLARKLGYEKEFVLTITD